MVNIWTSSQIGDKFTGSGKMLVLAYVDDMFGTHYNLEEILSHLQIDKCSYITDKKVIEVLKF